MINFIVASTVATLFAASLIGRHRFSPVRIWLAMWTVTWAINFLIGDVYYYSGEAVLIVVLGISFYTLGAFVFWTSSPKDVHVDDMKTAAFMDILMRSNSLTYLTTLTLLAQLPLIDLGMRKFSNSTLIVLLTSGRERMFEIMKESQATLYLNNEFNFPVEFKLVTLFTTFLAIFIFVRLSAWPLRKWDVANALLLALISLVFSASANVRSLLLVPIIVGFFSFYTGAILNRRTHLFTKKYIILGVSSVLTGFAAWIVVVQSARMGDTNFDRIGATLNHMRPWFAGYIPALSVWYDDNIASADYTWGGYFFRAILAPLGLVSGEGFDERVDAVGIGNWQTSNAMTIFRVLIADFGPIGTLFATFVLGYVGEFTYRKTITQAGPWTVLLIAFNCACFFSINFWFFFYGARVFSFIGAALVMALLSRSARRRVMRLRAKLQNRYHSPERAACLTLPDTAKS